MARTFGFLVMVAGLAVGWFVIFIPLQQAQAHAAIVHTSIKGFVFVPLALVSGFALFVGGNSVAPIFRGAPQGAAQKAMAFVIMAFAFSSTALGWWFFKSYLATRGYGA